MYLNEVSEKKNQKILASGMFLTVQFMRIKILSFEVKFNFEKQLLAQCTSA